jgi:hypothetical protein
MSLVKSASEKKVAKRRPSSDPKKMKHCCICSSTVLPIQQVIEKRPSGNSGEVETWFYCVKCWSEMKRLRRIPVDSASLLRVIDPSADLDY